MKTFFLMPSLDQTDLTHAVEVARAVAQHPFVSSFKVGFSLGLGYGLPKVVAELRALTDKPIIYDHQKAGTDIPETGALFAKTMKQAGISEAILFPQAGPRTLEAWVRALQEQGVTPVLGALMTHAGFVEREGGYLRDAFTEEAYALSASLGVTRFVVPLTKPERVAALEFPEGSVFYSPGYGAQGGDPHAFPAQKVHHLIAGRSLFAAPDPVAYVEAMARELGPDAQGSSAQGPRA
jgi:orotidine-5'-phosphate decarboxylase